MKTFSCVIIQLLLLLLICGVAIAEDNFPVQVKQYFENEKILEIETYSSSEKLFAAIARDQNHERVLYAFQYINGKWECFAKTKNAIPKMKLKVFVSVSDTYQDSNIESIQNIPNISIWFMEPNEDHYELLMFFCLMEIVIFCVMLFLIMAACAMKTEQFLFMKMTVSPAKEDMFNIPHPLT